MIRSRGVSHVYGDDVEAYTIVRERFKVRFGREATGVCRAPGRVNLIGEHTDYNGYPVCPCAIQQDCIMAFRPNDDGVVRLSNVDSQRWTEKEWPRVADDGLDVDRKTHHWSNYFACGWLAISEELSKQPDDDDDDQQRHQQHHVGIGIDVMVYGRVPIGSGLSSSSAMVVCSSLVVLRCQAISRLVVTPLRLAQITAESERHIGMQSGGMDQAISVLAEAGRAKRIDFDPLRHRDVMLPEDAALVISDSGVEACKYASRASGYNMRVVETRMAALILAKAMGLSTPDDCTKLVHVQQHSGLSLTQLLEKVEKYLVLPIYQTRDLVQLLNIPEDELRNRYFNVDIDEVNGFKLRQRARHVFSEAARVERFTGQQQQQQQEVTLEQMGQWMNESHVSCRDDYECSCAELDQLVEQLRARGALGSRLTGAGWGGFAVSLIKRSQVAQFQAHAQSIITRPSLGACYVVPDVLGTFASPLPNMTLLDRTSDSQSFATVDDWQRCLQLPVGSHCGAFAFKRKHHTHEGVDLYAPQGEPVHAVEAGIVVRVEDYTGPKAGSPWWLDTQAVLVEGSSVVVCYGEVTALVSEGDKIDRGQLIGKVQRVLKVDKGRPCSMLHFEVYEHGYRGETAEWEGEERPAGLLDPTPYLSHLFK